jgi:membrane-associated protease RseP (regulator of RpoE activity)
MSLDESLPTDGAPPDASAPPRGDALAHGAPESDRAAESGRLSPVQWKTNLGLFLLTLVSVFYAGASYDGKIHPDEGWLATLKALPQGYRFALPLLGILLFHEFGHFIAARAHRVDASLPFFIPFPHYSPLGTMGAVISMRGRIRSRNALLDIGASGPLAGLAVAIPVLAYGLSQSRVGPADAHGLMEGQSLFYLVMKRVVLGPMPADYDVFLGPMAFAGWGGLLVTALNLIPIGQLDGGHIAYALFGPKQNRVARVLHLALLGMFAFNLIRFSLPVLRSHDLDQLWMAFSNSLSWLIWFIVLGVLMRVSGRDHPPTEPGELSPVRKGIAVVSLILFVLLFMPSPMTQY